MDLVMEIANDISIREVDEMFNEIEKKYKHIFVSIGVQAKVIQ